MIAVICTALVCCTLIVLWLTAPKTDPARSLGEFVTKMSAQHAEDLRLAYFRRHDEHQRIIDALIGDRERLVTAVLARQDPHAARAVGVIDQAMAREQRVDTRAMFDALVERDTAQNTAEYVDPETNQPIIPVGMG